MVSKIYNNQEFADGVIIKTDDVSLTLEQNSTLYAGVDAVLSTSQNFHIIIDDDGNDANTGGFTVRTGAKHVDQATELFKITPDGELHLKNYILPLEDGANGAFLITDGAGQTFWGYQNDVAVANTLIEGTGVHLNAIANTDGWSISIGQPVEPTSNVSFNVVTADLIGDVTGQVSDISNHTTSSLAEGSNLYFTTQRARDSISVSGDLYYNNGVVSYTIPSTIASLSNHTTSSLAEGANLYFTTQRARQSISATGSDIAYNQSTGVISFIGHHYDSADFASDFATKTTNDLAEGNTNLYFTDERAQNAIAVDGDLSYANGVISYETPTTIASIGNHNTDALYEGNTNLYYTSVRAQADAKLAISAGGNLSYANGVVSYTTPTTIASLANHTTDNLAQGNNNLYYTDGKARQSISVTDVGGDGSLSYDNLTGVITYVGPAANEIRAHFSAGVGISITDGVIASTNIINLSAVAQNIIPASNVTYDLGSSTNRWRDLYLSGSTIYLGSAVMSAAGDGSINLPAGSKVNGVLIGTGSGVANTVLVNNTNRSGTLSYDCSTSLEFMERNITATIDTIQLTNLTLTDLQKKVVKVQIVQGTTAYIPAQLMIGSDYAPVFWPNGVVPIGTSEGIDTLTFEVTKEQYINKYFVVGSISSTKLTPPSYTVASRATSGLVLEYDIGNPNSYYDYFNTPTLLKDVSGNNKHATLYGGWNVDTNTNYMDFYGGYFITPNLEDLITTESHTIEIWVRIDSYNTNVWSYLGQDSLSGYHTSGLNVPTAGPSGLAQSGIYNGTSVADRVSAGSGTLTNTWKCFVRNFNGTTHNAYMNGVLINSVSSGWYSPHIDYAGEFRIAVGVSETSTYNNGAQAALDGKIGIMRVYNRQLSTGEILSNFDNTKSKYGL